jgi:hypothetical protein
LGLILKATKNKTSVNPYLSTKSSGSYKKIALWLVLCLLFAQWLGYAHSISHSALQTEVISSNNSPSSYIGCFDHQQAGHSCALLEAGTLGASLTVPFFQITATALPSFVLANLMRFGFQQRFVALFSSRAPPAHH